MHLPPERKTIKTCGVGGIAGGEKYICHSIFFKFATDSYIPGAKIWMYGGATRNDTAAMKGAGLDLQGLMSYYDIKVSGLHFPLMALIDYRYSFEGARPLCLSARVLTPPRVHRCSPAATA